MLKCAYVPGENGKPEVGKTENLNDRKFGACIFSQMFSKTLEQGWTGYTHTGFWLLPLRSHEPPGLWSLFRL